jgi:integrase
MKEKLTKTAVENVKPQAKDTWISDATLPGFYARITPQGERLYYARYSRNGQRFTVPIGRHGAITCETARRAAKKVMGEVALGGNPAGDRKEARESLTLAEFSDLYVEDYAEVLKKPSSVTNDRIYLRVHIKPALGAKKVAGVTRQDVERLHSSLKATPISGNRVLALLSSMFSKAAAWGYRTDPNPCQHVERYPERGRKRYLSPGEVKTLAEAITTAEDAQLIPKPCADLFRLLMVTGCRRGEIIGLRWADVDFAGRCLRLRDSKTGAKMVYLNEAALEIFGRIERKNEWVIPSNRLPGEPLENPKKAWARVCKLAKLDDFHMHDCRHSFASVAVGAGLGLPIIGALLGHQQARTTERYSHLQDDPLRAATDAIGGLIAGMMNGKAAEVVEIDPAAGGQTEKAQEAAGGRQ